MDARYNEILDLTKELVAIPSLNNSMGERAICEHIVDKLRQLPYFMKHPEQVIVQPLKNDPYDRVNVIGVVKGEKSDCKDTMILHGHIDTVGIDDFGSIAEYAFDCDALPEKIREITKDEDVIRDIESGEWMFGRGASDMKSGVAVNFVLTKQMSERVDEMDGNIIFMINPVEENQHTGIMNSLEVLEKLKAEEGFNYVMAINTDFIAPAYPGDTAKYFHAGAVGKILPCFYIVGKPTHAGQGFEGFSASKTAAEIVNQMDLRAEFADVYNGEFTLPPVALKVKDLKPSYDVQTAFAAFVYFNYFIHSMSMVDIMERLKDVARKSLYSVMAYTNDQYRIYCNMTGMEYHQISYPLEVLEYSELYDRVKSMHDGDIDEVITKITKTGLENKTDSREITREITETLCTMASINTPTVVVFIAPPYCPRNTLKSDVPEEKEILDSVAGLLKEMAAETGEDLKLMQFFPVLTDSSYLKIDDDQESVDTLVKNFPDFKGLYNVPIESIQRLNIPAFNFGCLGKDAHKWTERVNTIFSFGVLPGIIQRAIDKYLIQ